MIGITVGSQRRSHALHDHLANHEHSIELMHASRDAITNRHLGGGFGYLAVDLDVSRTAQLGSIGTRLGDTDKAMRGRRGPALHGTFEMCAVLVCLYIVGPRGGALGLALHRRGASIVVQPEPVL